MQSQQKLSRQSVFKAATEANQYARGIILKSNTHLDANKMTPEHARSLTTCIDACNAKMRASLVNDNDVEADIDIKVYEAMIATSAKYSVGNCHELALHAFDYIHYLYPDIHAEIIYITGVKSDNDGDHVFVVYQRDAKSHANDPSTWGADALIGDPWSGSGIVYSAAAYKTHLKNFVIIDHKNMIEDISSEKHKLVAMDHINTNYFKSARTTENLKINLLKICEELISPVFACLQKSHTYYAANDKKNFTDHTAMLKALQEHYVKMAEFAKTTLHQYQQKNYAKEYRKARREMNADYLKFLQNLKALNTQSPIIEVDNYCYAHKTISLLSVETLAFAVLTGNSNCVAMLLNETLDNEEANHAFFVAIALAEHYIVTIFLQRGFKPQNAKSYLLTVTEIKAIASHCNTLEVVNDILKTYHYDAINSPHQLLRINGYDIARLMGHQQLIAQFSQINANTNALEDTSQSKQEKSITSTHAHHFFASPQNNAVPPSKAVTNSGIKPA